jgi:D-alanine--poly(phosphoribitol) ligase subunit 2
MISDAKTEDRIVAILEQRSGAIIPQQGRESYRYVEQGIVDSMNLITFIIELEETFDIELDPADTESDEFRTIGGLVQIVTQKSA